MFLFIPGRNGANVTRKFNYAVDVQMIIKLSVKKCRKIENS